MTEPANIKKRKSFVGEVASTKMDKTVVIVVNRLTKHPVYKKYITRRKKLYAHDETNRCKTGDKVMIEETRPLSKLKRWRVIKVVEEAK